MTKTKEDTFKPLGEVLENVLEKIKPAGRVEKYVLPEKCRADFVKENAMLASVKESGNWLASHWKAGA